MNLIRVNKFVVAIIGLLLVLVAVSCTPTGNEIAAQPTETPTNEATDKPFEEATETPTNEATENPLIGTEWDLIMIGDVDISDEGMTLAFTEDAISGSDGCNSFSGSYAIEDGALVVSGPMAMTMMACSDMEMGSLYTGALMTTGAFSLDGGRLTIESDGVNMEFVTPELAGLGDTQWQLSGLATGDAIVNMAIDENIYLLIEGDMVSGSGGCNRFSGGVTIDGDQLSFGNLLSTAMACVDNEVNERETAFLAALNGVTRYDILRQTLTLYGAEDQLIATFKVKENEPVTKTLYVGAEEVDCTGVAPQKCLLVKEDPNSDYTFFYSSIDGFEWEVGYEYELLVNVTEIDNPPADASSLRYELVEVVSKTAVSSDATLEGIRWSLDHLLVDGESMTAPYGISVYFTIDGDSISGNSGCNNFMGSVVIDGENIQFGRLATTRMACEEARMAIESAMLAQHEMVSSYGIDGKTLELRDSDGVALALFAAAEEKTFYVGAEQVDCVGAWSQKCLLVKEEADAEYTFFYSKIVGFEWEAGFEYELLVAVTEVVNPPADASSLQYTLIEVVSKTAVVAEADETDSQLIDIVWQWERFEDTADLNSYDVDEPADYTITFLAEGTYQMRSDCNSGSGGYTMDNGSLMVKPGITTLAACAEGSLDGEFGRLLGEVVSFVIEDGRLFLNLIYDSGDLVFSAAP